MTDDRSRENPFLRYRERLDVYLVALGEGWTDAEYVSLVERLDAAVAEVDGHGFARTPLVAGSAVVAAAGLDCKLVLKDDTGNVGGSHKARHLFGLALHHAVTGLTEGALAIASCGNAALAAGVVAAALDRELQVYVPEWADTHVLGRLESLGAKVRVCERRPGELGDPAFLRYRDAVAGGATPFTVQGTEAPAVIDGGRTLGWELAEELAAARGATAHLDVLYVQVGGGALATAVAMAMFDAVDSGWLAAPPRFRAVQPANAHPLVRAWNRLVGDSQEVEADVVLAAARAHPDRYMTPWEEPPTSIASGILDDVTYDWLGVIEAMAKTGGTPVLATEADFATAHDLIAATTDIGASPTGTAGLAGLLAAPPAKGEKAAVLITGRT